MGDYLKKMKEWYQKMTTKEASYEKPSIRPGHDWMIIFITAQLVILIAAGAAYYFYQQVDQGKIFYETADSVGTEVKVNLNLLKKTVDDLNAREATTNKIKQGKSGPSDPSL